jgi:hypothetical protein
MTVFRDKPALLVIEAELDAVGLVAAEILTARDQRVG